MHLMMAYAYKSAKTLFFPTSVGKKGAEMCTMGSARSAASEGEGYEPHQPEKALLYSIIDEY